MPLIASLTKTKESDRSYFSFWVFIIALFFTILRWPLVDVPMERDEGEYATMGLGILHGIPPYLEAYTMKWPGAASMYAIIFWLLGPTAKSVHLALLLLNVLSIVMVAILGRRFLGKRAGLFAGAAYGTYTIGLGMLGLWLYAEHFVVFFLLMGACVMPNTIKGIGSSRLIFGSFLLGIAILMKQHALFPAIALLFSMGWMVLEKEEGVNMRKRLLGMTLMLVAFILPFVSTCLVMMRCGVYPAFKFWTFQYAYQYVSNVPLALGWEYCKFRVTELYRDAPLLWALALGGAGILVWKPFSKQIATSVRILFLSTALASLFAASMGLLFRGQYFILVTPFAALFSGLAWQTFCERIRITRWVHRIIGLAMVIGAFLVLLEPWLLGIYRTPNEISRLVFGLTPFPESPIVADYLKHHTQENEKIAIIGSEPQIYFLANRRPSLPYIYTYEMTENHAFAREMQDEFIRCMEKSRPRYIVVADYPTSLGITLQTHPVFAQWLLNYRHRYYQLDGIVDLISKTNVVIRWGEQARTYRPQSSYSLMIFVRKN